MPLHLSASPAKFEQGVMSMLLCDPNEITKRVSPTSLAAAKAEFETFVGGLPDGDWAVHGCWVGDRAPRGFKIARERREFTRTIRATTVAAQKVQAGATAA
jgi:hypothetical protein